MELQRQGQLAVPVYRASNADFLAQVEHEDAQKLGLPKAKIAVDAKNPNAHASLAGRAHDVAAACGRVANQATRVSFSRRMY